MAGRDRSPSTTVVDSNASGTIDDWVTSSPSPIKHPTQVSELATSASFSHRASKAVQRT